MYFTKIRLSTIVNVDLPIIGAQPSDPYLLKGADGLGPVEIVVSIMNGVYQNSEPQDREIVLRVGLNPNYGVNQTAEQLRTTLYGLLSPSPTNPLFVQLMNDNVIVSEVEGHVSKIEPALFTKDPEVQITIECVGSYLLSPDDVSVVPSTKDPFSVTNVGSAPVGFRAELTFTNSMDSFTIQRQGSVFDLMSLVADFAPGDTLIIDTRDELRELTWIQAGGAGIYNLIGGLSVGSTWLQLYPGVNTFDPDSSSFNWGSILFTPRFWGV